MIENKFYWKIIRRAIKYNASLLYGGGGGGGPTTRLVSKKKYLWDAIYVNEVFIKQSQLPMFGGGRV